MPANRFRLLVATLVVALAAVGWSAATDGEESTTDREDTKAEPAATATPSDPAPATSTSPPQPASAPDRIFVRVQFDDIIDDAEVAALEALPGVAAVSARREDDGALWSSRRANGTPVDDLPPEFKVSVALEVDRPGLPVHPGPGEVVLTAAGAAFRDLDVGAVVELTDRVERTVVAVTDDPALADVEFVVADEDAESLEIRERQRALITLEETADTDELVAAISSLLGSDAIVQARPALDRPMVLSLPATKARFGEFAFRDLPGRDIQAGASWIEEYVVETEIPIIGTVVCNRMIIDDLTAVMDDLIEAGLEREIDPDLYGGCWAPRRINRNANLSRHAWGIAIDVNVDFDEPGLGPIPSDGVIEAFERHGFRWGGDYPVPDNHHFEWVGTG